MSADMGRLWQDVSTADGIAVAIDAPPANTAPAATIVHNTEIDEFLTLASYAAVESALWLPTDAVDSIVAVAARRTYFSDIRLDAYAAAGAASYQKNTADRNEAVVDSIVESFARVLLHD